MPGDPQLSFGIITDLHLGWDDAAAENVRAALDDFHDLNLDLIVILGDMVDTREELWPLATELIVNRVQLPTLFVRGNADYQAGGPAAWSAAIPQAHRHTCSMGGVHFTLVGAEDDSHRVDIGDDAPEWVVSDMAEHADEVGIVLCHSPVKDTTFWSCDNRGDGCLATLLPPDNPPYRLFLRQTEEMADALRRCPNVRLFLTGHVHNDHRMRCDHGYGVSAEKDGVIHIVTANLGGWQDLGVERREGHIVTIGPDAVRVRTRNVRDRRYVPELDLTFATQRP